mgnify:FL=1
MHICYVSYSEGIKFFLDDTLAVSFAQDKAFGRRNSTAEKNVKVYKFHLYDTIPNFSENHDAYLFKTFN